MCDFGLSQRARLADEQPIGRLMDQALNTPVLISLAAGFVDTDSLPTGEVDALWRSLMQDL